MLLKLINEILNISRIESGTLRPLLEKVDLQQFARDLEMLFKQSMENKQLDFRVLCTVKNRLVEADSQHMQTICVNLIANAQKFTPAGGKVAMCIEQLETQAEQAVYRIQVSDTGIGMRLQANGWQSKGGWAGFRAQKGETPYNAQYKYKYVAPGVDFMFLIGPPKQGPRDVFVIVS